MRAKSNDVEQVELTVQVTPRASANQVGRYEDGLLRVRVTRPPADGEANRAVLNLVARRLRMPSSALTLVAGARSRTKRYAIEGLSAAELHLRLAAATPASAQQKRPRRRRIPLDG